MTTLVFINGEKADSSDIRLKLLTPAFTGESAAFETLRTYNGKIFALHDHLKRLKHSARLLGFRLPVPISEIAKQASTILRLFYLQNDIIHRSRDLKIADLAHSGLRTAATINFTVYNNRSGDTSQHSLKKNDVRLKIVVTGNDIIIGCQKLRADPALKRGVRVMFVRSERKLPSAKGLPYLESFKAHERARRAGYDEALLVDRSGFVTEGAYANIFWAKDGVLFTPPTAKVLPGITRKYVLEIAKQLRIRMRYKLPDKEELLSADEVFLTKTTTGPIPVREISGSLMGAKPAKRFFLARILERWNRFIAPKNRS